MRIHLCSFMLIAFAVSPGFSQSLHFGGCGGATFSQFYGNDAETANFDEGLIAGFAATGHIELSLTDRLDLRAGLGFAMKGAGMHMQTSVPPYVNISTETRIRLDYLELPVEIRCAFPLNGTAYPYLVGGIAPAILLDEKTSVTMNGSTSSDDNSGDFATFEAGIPLGIGVACDLGPGELFGEGRFILGLTKVPDSESEMKNRVFAICVGYTY
jgi:hypothetical protein